jgi:hypothetical protein
MDCQEKGMFHTSDVEYNEFLGIGEPQGFLGLKKLFNTKGYQSGMLKQMQSNRIELTPIQSIGYKPLSVEYGTPTRTTSTLTQTTTSSINTSDLLKNLLDTAIVIGKNKAQQSVTQTQPSADTTATQPVVTATADSKGYSQDPRGANVPKDNTMLYVGLAGAGILLISGIAYMASKGK